MGRKKAGQRPKMLALRRLLLEETDSIHPMPMARILEQLEAQGIPAERKGIYTDIAALRQEGLDVQYRGGGAGWFVASRDFQLAELKVLVDVVQASRFLTPRKSRQLIDKLSGLTSRHEAGQLRRQVYLEPRAKSENESVYYHVDKLHEAISGQKVIEFQYFDYTWEKKRQLRREGRSYVVSPRGLMWNYERYYLAAFDHQRQELRHYRVDKMQNVTVTKQTQPDADNGFDTARHSQRMFEMFRGREATVHLHCANDAAGLILDRFGMDVLLRPEGEEHFSLMVSVELSPPFWGWLFMMSDKVQLRGPMWVQELYGERLRLAGGGQK